MKFKVIYHCVCIDTSYIRFLYNESDIGHSITDLVESRVSIKSYFYLKFRLKQLFFEYVWYFQTVGFSQRFYR